ncbi:MAG: hypothetical protein EZS28_006591 [Streblomastix strix]|uniref:Uncharacterized protein n=1 Tax=Streblomastix strix TaxID=222440 RepID=A0A5J4WSG9_9EUKA|nr:MAG: hypothetical protein EZS28_006591 [Streblomastix strix]
MDPINYAQQKVPLVDITKYNICIGASVSTNAITQSPNFDLASGGQLLNKQPSNLPPPGNRHVVAYDTVSVVLSPQTINYGSEPQEHSALMARTLHLMRRQYRRYFSSAIAMFALLMVQVVVVARVALDNVL